MPVIDAKKCYDSRGFCVVHETEQDVVLSERIASRYELQESRLVKIAALFHDLGKNSLWFQNKLRSNKRNSDYIRHELISVAVLNALFYQVEDFDNIVESLCDPDTAKGLIQTAYEAAYAEPEKYVFNPNRKQEFSALLTDSKFKTKDFPSINISAESTEKSLIHPIIALIQNLIVSHHKQTGVNTNKKISVTNVAKSICLENDGKDIEGLKQLFTLPSKIGKIDIKPLWEDADWIKEVCAAFEELKHTDFSNIDFTLALKAASVYGRTALILGDHKASAFGNKNFPLNGRVDKSLVYANTNKATKQLAEPLGSHLVRVANDSAAAHNVIYSSVPQFPSLDYDDIPEAIRNATCDKSSPFRWQVDARIQTSKAFSKVPEKSGFFGVLLAGTGTGKTRAASVIMTAANSNDDIRLNVTSGLRTLTLQTGREYVKDMEFNEDDVQIAIGDELTRELFDFENSERANGTDAHQYDLVTMHAGAGVHYLPIEAESFLDQDDARAQKALLASPVLISTIDTLMPAASAHRGNHVIKMMRVASADLIIDEIDNFADEDIVALARLVYLTGVFGRKILLASATMYPEIAKHLFAAYEAGWKVHQYAHDRQAPIVAGWYADGVEQICLTDVEPGLYEQTHDAFTQKIESALDAKPVRRSAIIAEVNLSSAGEYFSDVTKACLHMHDLNHQIDPISNKKLSVGVVRFTNVYPSYLYCEYLNKHIQAYEGKDIFILPYNGSQLPITRFQVERTLNSMLKRKTKNGEDPVFRHDAVRNILDKRASENDVLILIVTTSMEEVGRDHDFDYAVMEPGSERSLIQMAGRVRRHRQSEYGTKNLTILRYAFRELHSKDRKSIFAYPGVETPVSSKSNKQNYKLASYDAFAVYDNDAIGFKIDARNAVLAKEPSSLLAALERKKNKDYLSGDVSEDKAGIPDFLSDAGAFIHGHYGDCRRFRRKTEDEALFRFDPGDRKWRALIKEKPKEPDKRKKIHTPDNNKKYKCQVLDNVEEIEINEDCLFIEISDEFDDVKQIANKIWNIDQSEQKMQYLTSIQRPKPDKNASAHAGIFRYNKYLGFSAKPKWVDGLKL